MRMVMVGSLILLVFGSPLGCSSGSPEPPEPPAPAQSGDSPADTLLLPPATSVEALMEGPTFTPFTVGPSVKNRRAVAAALERAYPRRQRDSGIGGVAEFWFFVDAEGVLRKIVLHKSSGVPALDVAARSVARMIEFTPGFNKDRPVPVWISLPITFTVR